MVDVYEISAIVAAVGVLVGVAYYILDMRNQARTRQTDMVLRLYSTFSSEEFQITLAQIDNLKFQNTDDFLQKYGSKVNAEVWGKWQSVAAFFEQVGVLLHRKLINISLVDDLLTTDVKQQWERMAPVILDIRKRLDSPQIWEWFEYLYNEMKKREQKRQQVGVKNA